MNLKKLLDTLVSGSFLQRYLLERGIAVRAARIKTRLSGVEYVLVQPAEGFLHAGEGQG